MNKPLFALIFLVVAAHGGTLRVHNIKIDSGVVVRRVPGVAALDSVFGVVNGSRVMRACPYVTGTAYADSAGGAARLGGQPKAYYDTVGNGANRDRANHTGVQAISTVTGLQTAIDSKQNMANFDDSMSHYVNGTTGTLSKFTAPRVLGNSVLSDNGTNVITGSAYLSNDGTSDEGISFDVYNTAIITNQQLTAGDRRISVYARDITATASGVGGGIGFQGKYNFGGSYTDFASIKGIKANGTDGNVAGQLEIQTRPALGLPITRMKIDENGNIGINNTAPANRVTLDASASPAWHSNYTVVDVRGYGSVYGSSNGAGYPNEYGQCGIVQNSYYDGTNSRAIGTGAGSYIFMSGGKIFFFGIPTVSAGSIQTPKNIMIMDENGGMRIGTNFLSNDGTANKGLFFDYNNTPVVFNTSMTDGDCKYSLVVRDDAAMTTGVGGGILFQGNDGTVVDRNFAGIKGVKANATSGNTSGQLHFQTRANGGLPTTRLTIDENGKTDILALPALSYDTRSVLDLYDRNSYYQGMGAGLSFGGKYNSSGDYTKYAGIKGVKANSTDGNTESQLSFQIRANGGNLNDAVIIDGSGRTVIGDDPSMISEKLNVTGAIKLDDAANPSVLSGYYSGPAHTGTLINCYWTGGQWRFRQSGKAALITQNSGAALKIFRSTAAGSPDAAITWEAMLDNTVSTLDADLIAGDTTIASGTVNVFLKNSNEITLSFENGLYGNYSGGSYREKKIYIDNGGGEFTGFLQSFYPVTIMRPLALYPTIPVFYPGLAEVGFEGDFLVITLRTLDSGSGQYITDFSGPNIGIPPTTITIYKM